MTANNNVINRLLGETSKVVFGMEDMLQLVAYTLVAGGHSILEGVPGVAKSHTVNAFGRAFKDATWARFQMTPNSQPNDFIGDRIFNEETRKFEILKGKIFNNLVLADEINRATPRTQSGLLEAMGEGSVSIAGETFKLNRLFSVLATMNPIEQEGTYPLPEAQLDRFFFKIIVKKAPRDARLKMQEQQNMLKGGGDPCKEITPAVTVEELLAVRDEVMQVHIAPAAHNYILDLVDSTDPDEALFAKLVSKAGPEGQTFKEAIEIACGPRTNQALVACSRARAYHMGRDHVLPEDIQFLVPHVMRHRLGLSRRFKNDRSPDRFTTDKAALTVLKNVEFHANPADYQRK